MQHTETITSSGNLSTAQLYQTALVHHQAGRLPQAEAIYKQILGTEARHPDAIHLLGVIAHQVGQFQIAIDLINYAISIDSTNTTYHNNLGNTLQEQRRFDESVASYRKALLLKPDFAEAQNNLGTVLQKQGRFDEAVASYREALSLRPEYADAHSNLGIALQHQRKFVEAAASYRTAISLKSDHAETYSNLGTVFHQQGKFVESVASYEKGIALKPDYAEAYSNLGSALQNLNRIDEAVASYEKALTLKPNFAEAYSNLLVLHATMRDISPEAELALARKWERCILGEAACSAARERRFVRQARAGRKLRVGIVSAEIGDHSVAEFLEPILEQFDHDRFHITLFPSRLRREARAARICALADDCKPLFGFSDAEAAELIRFAEMDILMDTTGHTEKCRLGIFAHRAAPVQLTYLGYWSTTGLTEMDWVFADIYSPSFLQNHFSEKFWRLPRLAVCYRGDESLPSTRWQPSSDGKVWLGSFNRYCKIREATLNLWAKVMKSIPESMLLLEDRAADNSDTHRQIVSILGSHGIAAERIEFEPYITGHERHMVLYDRLDIALDTIPFNSGTTACDALWMGVPIVAIEGNWSGARITGAFLNAINKPEWVAQNEEEYVEIVARLARDVEGRTALRSAQRSLVAKSPLCDSKTLMEAIQGAFEEMFDVYQTKNISDVSPLFYSEESDRACASSQSAS
jgi:predicted O-linked N-acetylglucosamine transferase (SPINDLY family)